MGTRADRMGITATVGTTAQAGTPVTGAAAQPAAALPKPENPQIAKDFEKANAPQVPQSASLDNFSLKAGAEAHHLGRAGKGSVGVQAEYAYRPGTNASAHGMSVGGHAQFPVVQTPVGPVSVIARANAGAVNIAGSGFGGWAGQLAADLSARMLVKGLVPVDLGLGVQTTNGRLSNGRQVDDWGVTINFGVGLDVVRRGQLAWKLPEAEKLAHDPQSPSKCEETMDAYAITGSKKDLIKACKKYPDEAYDTIVSKLNRTRVTPETMADYQSQLLELAGLIGSSGKILGGDKGLESGDVADLMNDLYGLWKKTNDHGFFVNQLMPALLTKRTEVLHNKELLKKVADLHDKMLQDAAKSVAPDQVIQLQLDTLTNFYAPLFGKNVQADVKTDFRGRADKVIADLIKWTRKHNPAYLPSIITELKNKTKGSDLLTQEMVRAAMAPTPPAS